MRGCTGGGVIPWGGFWGRCENVGGVIPWGRGVWGLGGSGGRCREGRRRCQRWGHSEAGLTPWRSCLGGSDGADARGAQGTGPVPFPGCPKAEPSAPALLTRLSPQGRSQPSPCSQPRPPPGTPRLCPCCSRPPTLTLRTLSSTVSALSPWALLASPPCPQRAQVRPCTCPWPRPCRPWAPPWPFCPWARCTQQDPPCCWRGAWTALPGWAQVALPASSRRPPGAPRVPSRCRSRPEPPSCCPPARGASRGGPGGASASGEEGPGLGVPPAPLGVPPRSAPPPRNLHWAWGPQRWGGKRDPPPR